MAGANFVDRGLGSRISAGYGRANKIIRRKDNKELIRPDRTSQHRSEHGLKLWSQGIYGADPNKREFRPATVRGMLRYWLRAIALGLYSPKRCKELEHRLFGALEPEAVQGSVA